MVKNLATPARPRGRPRLVAREAEAPVQSIDRAFALLALLADHNGLTLTEVAQQAGLAPSTAYRMLTTMQAHGVVEFGEREQLWFVGVETFRMGAAFLRRRRLADQGRAVIQELMHEAGETANLALAEDTGVVFVSQVETHAAIRAFFRPGTRSEYHCSGVGKAILAQLSPRELDARLGRQRLAAYTPKTLATRAALLENLATIRARGFSVDDEERHLGMRCVAAAVFDEHGEPVGGVSISGPTVRLDDARLAALGPRVADAARQLTHAMGGRMPG
jgi:IclR family acetate operon transcriptional repressor